VRTCATVNALMNRVLINDSVLPVQVNDRRNGKGTYVFSNGSRYTGHWWENDIHTKGRFDYACGSYYRGEMKFDFPNGTAVSLPM
jgi:hypothetical protein